MLMLFQTLGVVSQVSNFTGKPGEFAGLGKVGGRVLRVALSWFLVGGG